MTARLRAVPGRWRRLSLRARLTLLVAAAVGAAVTVVAVAGYVFTRNQLRAQLDGALLLQARAFQAGPPLTPGEVARLRADRSLGPLLTSFQLLRPDGTATRPAQQALALPVDAADLAVARGSRPLHLRDVTVGGAHLRVATLPYGDGAVQISRSLREVDRSLTRLRLLLGVLALVGMATSSTVGLLVARAGLASVERLTGAAEHIAATEDMSAPIDVTGHDEVARLARSFNAMLTALDASRQRQRQFVADAGHELRTPLASLRANIEMLVRERRHPSRRLSTADGDALLADLTAQLDELVVLVNELVDLARDEHPDEPAGPVALDRVVNRSVRRA
ncbi:MAG TPA: histidine kinase dimerization/phospho-acceptor domain-containing protein [Frankiaceae bacterium]|nr:histidine kinase dimerization/phospho-acceptor domain-containing protein [Frankiaceae bacterium]